MTDKKQRDQVEKGPLIVSFTPRSILCLLNFVAIDDRERRRLQRRFERLKHVSPAEQRSWEKYLESDKALKKTT